MANEEKVNVVRFSLPYRPGMESEAGYKEKKEMVSKTFGDAEKEFASFEFPLDNSIVVDQAVALETGLRVLRQNKQRANLIGDYAKKYSIVAPGISGGMTKKDMAILEAICCVTQNANKVKAVFKMQTGKEVSDEEIAPVLEAVKAKLESMK